MIIKLLYVVFIFLVVRLIFNTLTKINHKNVSKPSSQKDEDIIDAEYKVVSDDDESK